MKKIMLLAMLFIATVIYATEVPDWVKFYIEKGTIKNQKEYYFGIGSSENSKREADKIALMEFGKSIETKIQSEQKDYFKESQGKVTEKISQKITVNSKVGLKGVSITGRYNDGKTYYSIISYKKKEYNKILKDEVKRDLERQRIKLAKKIEENKISEEKKNEAIRKEQENKKIQEKISKMKEGFMMKLRNKHPEFFDSAPPYKAVSFRNGQLIPHKQQLNIKAGLYPISFEEIFYAYQIWLFEFSSISKFYDNKYIQQELQFKYQILPYSGKFYKFSAAFGFTGYQTDVENYEDSDTRIYTPFIAGNITLPNLYFSFGSAYIDMGKASLAINNYLFYKQLKDKLSVILEVNTYFDEKLRNSRDEKIVFQPAITFKTTKNLSTTFSFEDNELLKIGVEIGF